MSTTPYLRTCFIYLRVINVLRIGSQLVVVFSGQCSTKIVLFSVQKVNGVYSPICAAMWIIYYCVHSATARPSIYWSVAYLHSYIWVELLNNLCVVRNALAAAEMRGQYSECGTLVTTIYANPFWAIFEPPKRVKVRMCM